MRGSLKVIICFQTRIEKYIEENNLPPKLSRHTRNGIPPKRRSTCHGVHHKIAIIGNKNITTTSIYLAVQTLSFSKAIGSCAQKAKILVVTVEFRTNILPLIMISEVDQLY